MYSGSCSETGPHWGSTGRFLRGNSPGGGGTCFNRFKVEEVAILGLTLGEILTSLGGSSCGLEEPTSVLAWQDTVISEVPDEMEH